MISVALLFVNGSNKEATL